MKHELYVIGMGPGREEKMTLEALQALEACDTIVGYTVYVDLLKTRFPDKEYMTTPMRQETKRCRMAFEEAQKGKRVAMVCSGDAGVYGMSGLMLELGSEYPDCQVTVISGVTAALAGAALLGAPLMHDFAVISLSDLLTPWEKIEKRLRAAAAGLELVGGVVKSAGREGECAEVMYLSELEEYPADMFTTVFIGNSETRIIDGRMVTPRGYQNI